MNYRFLQSAVVLGATFCLATPLACGSSDSNPSPSGAGQSSGGAMASAGTPATSNGGTGGTGTSGGGGGTGGVILPPGTSTTPKTIQCGGDCTSARAVVYVDPCCTADNTCGVDTTYLTMTGAMFKQSCEPKNQPGELNEACPKPAASMINVMGTMVSLDALPGCCRPNGTCGVSVNVVTAAGGLLPVADLGLGCVDPESFFPGMAPVPCTRASGGDAGASSGGAGGAP